MTNEELENLKLELDAAWIEHCKAENISQKVIGELLDRRSVTQLELWFTACFYAGYSTARRKYKK